MWLSGERRWRHFRTARTRTGMQRGLWPIGLLFSSLLLGSAAHASGLSVAGSGMSAGSSAVSACDADGVAYRYTVNGSAQITSVTVDSIAGACAGGQLRVTLANGLASLVEGLAALPSSGFTGSATVSVADTQSSQVTRVLAVIEGP